jgi:hypothetical protein
LITSGAIHSTDPVAGRAQPRDGGGQRVREGACTRERQPAPTNARRPWLMRRRHAPQPVIIAVPPSLVRFLSRDSPKSATFTTKLRPSSYRAAPPSSPGVLGGLSDSSKFGDFRSRCITGLSCVSRSASGGRAGERPPPPHFLVTGARVTQAEPSQSGQSVGKDTGHGGAAHRRWEICTTATPPPSRWCGRRCGGSTCPARRAAPPGRPARPWAASPRRSCADMAT